MAVVELKGVASREDVVNLFGSVRMGDFMLIENYSIVGSELTLYALLNYAYERGLPVLVEDIFDAFAGYLRHFDVMGITPPLEHVGVLKIGGIDELGHVVDKIQFEADPTLYLQKKERAIERAMGDERYVYIVTGFERLLGFQRDVKGIYVIVNHMRETLGNGRRMTFNLIESNVINGFSMNPLPLLESVATSVVELHDHGDMLRLRFRKSILNLLEGRNEVFLHPFDVVEWW
ncbi:DUF257 family protein [Thermococcus sp.]|uniref:DUF257 family protein n=1 Tax=Thermococcus sp. TaxID=35749 RepID=UPI0025E71C09|nr:DUF257 family protein [Thermococcus sp.]